MKELIKNGGFLIDEENNKSLEMVAPGNIYFKDGNCIGEFIFNNVEDASVITSWKYPKKFIFRSNSTEINLIINDLNIGEFLNNDILVYMNFNLY